jgi:hypothetical protein
LEKSILDEIALFIGLCKVRGFIVNHRGCPENHSNVLIVHSLDELTNVIKLLSIRNEIIEASAPS